MTDIVDICNAASSAAGYADDGWNDRFVAALCRLGYELKPVSGWEQLPQDALMAPVPYEAGRQYPYPSILVSNRTM